MKKKDKTDDDTTCQECKGIAGKSLSFFFVITQLFYLLPFYLFLDVLCDRCNFLCCKSCFEKLHKNMLSSHKAIKIGKEILRADFEKEPCSKHKCALDFYCRTCSRESCIMCNRAYHSGHVVSSILAEVSLSLNFR